MNSKEQKEFNKIQSENGNLKTALANLKEELATALKMTEKYAPITDIETTLAEKQNQLNEQRTRLDELLGEIESVEQAKEILKNRDAFLKEAEQKTQSLQEEAELLKKAIGEYEKQYGTYGSAEKLIADAKIKAGEITANADSEASGLLKEANDEKTEIIADAKQEAEGIKHEAETIKSAALQKQAEVGDYVKEEKLKIEEERKRIIKDAQASARTIEEEARKAVETYYAGKEAEGNMRKEQIINKANSERDFILDKAKTDAEINAGSIIAEANKHAENVRASADNYATTVRAKADKLVHEAEEKVKEEKANAMTYRENELEKARKDADQIRAETYADMEKERNILEEQKRQLEIEQDTATQLHAKANRREERLNQREELLNEEVKEIVAQEYATLLQELEQVKAAYKNMKQRAEKLGTELGKNRNYEDHRIEVNQFNTFMEKLKEKNIVFSEDVCSQLINALQEYKNLQKRYESLEKEISKLRQDNGNLTVAQSRANSQDEMLKQEEQKSFYYQSEVKRLWEELEKNRATSRDDMLRPVRQAPEFLDKNLPLYTEKDELKWLELIKEKAEKNGLYFTKRQLYAFHTAHKIHGMSPTVVLAGISGTGKSELPRNYALYGGMHFLSIPVKPDWDSPASLFGYYNSIEKRFEASELLRALWQMKTDLSYRDRMLMVLLDEMNLAHPEQYFADILSKLETSRGNGDAEYDILLGGGEKPEKIAIGSNILWTGTMNEDETTKGLSDKVIDRSTLITFPRPKTLRSRRTNYESEKQKMEFVLPRSTWNGWLDKRRGSSDVFDKNIAKYREAVEYINDYMSNMGRNLGHRVWQGIEEYIRNYPEVIYANDNELKLAMNKAFTDAIAFKIMPKLRGLEVSGRNGKNFDNIMNLLSENAPELEGDFNRAREMTTELFQWSSAEFMNEEQDK